MHEASKKVLSKTYPKSFISAGIPQKQKPCLIKNMWPSNLLCSAPCPSNKIQFLWTPPSFFFLQSWCFSGRKDTIRRWCEKLRFLLSLELGSNLLCSLFTLSLLPPPKQITYQYLNRKAGKSGNFFVVTVFCECIWFFPSMFIFNWFKHSAKSRNCSQPWPRGRGTSQGGEAGLAASTAAAGVSAHRGRSAWDSISHTNCHQQRELWPHLGQRQMSAAQKHQKKEVLHSLH